MVIDHGLGGEKRPSVSSIQEAAARTVDGRVQDTDVSSWLEELDARDKVRKAADPETRQFKVSEVEEATQTDTAAEATTKAVAETTTIIPNPVKEKKEPGKLPKRPDSLSANSRDAASEMLKKFFNRR
jgi:hypothetical protein